MDLRLVMLWGLIGVGLPLSGSWVDAASEDENQAEAIYEEYVKMGEEPWNPETHEARQEAAWKVIEKMAALEPATSTMLMRRYSEEDNYYRANYIINFLRISGIGQERVLPFVRQQLEAGRYESFGYYSDNTRLTLLLYLAEHGDATDIAEIEKFGEQRPDKMRRANRLVSMLNKRLSGSSNGQADATPLARIWLPLLVLLTLVGGIVAFKRLAKRRTH